MTAQLPDKVVHGGVEYDLVVINGDGLFDPLARGMEPFSASTGCWRGYQAIYTTAGGRLSLDTLKINLRNDPPPSIEGITATERGDLSLFNCFYENMALPVPFSGTLVIARGFIDSMYVHMGFHGPDCYEEVFRLTLKEGTLGAVDDLSGEMAKRREVGREYKPRSPFDMEPPGSVGEWVEKRFSRDPCYGDDDGK